MIAAIRKVALLVIVLAVAASAQQGATPATQTTKAKAVPCPTPSTAASPAASPSPDLSDIAKDACKTKKDCHWESGKGCWCVIELDGDGSNVMLIDPQSSTVQRNIADYEFNRLPVGRSLSDIINLP